MTFPEYNYLNIVALYYKNSVYVSNYYTDDCL
jgi:hypothetical protein